MVQHENKPESFTIFHVRVVTHQVNSVSFVCVSQLSRNKRFPFFSILCRELCHRHEIYIDTDTHTHYINIKSTAIKTTGRRQCYPLSPFTTKQNNNVILKLWVSTSLTLFSVMILVSNNYKTQIINKTFMLQILFHSFLCFKASSSLSPHMEVLFVLPKIRV